MSTEAIDPRYLDLDLWPTAEAVRAMLEGQMVAAAAVQPQAEAIALAAEDAAGRLQDPAGRLIYIGAGTSGRLAVLDGVELGPTYDWPAHRIVFALAGGMDAMLTSVEGAEDDATAAEAAMEAAKPGPADVAIGVAASGRTPFTVAGVTAAARAGALTIGIASNPGSTLLGAAAHPLLLDTGAEVVAGSTRMKAGTAQKVALNLISTAIMIRLGRVHAGLMVNMRLSNEKLRGRAVAMVARIGGVDASAAAAALDRSDARIKQAVLIALGLDREAAEERLHSVRGNLRAALDSVQRR